jgi:hypothetical protein
MLTALSFTVAALSLLAQRGDSDRSEPDGVVGTIVRPTTAVGEMELPHVLFFTHSAGFVHDVVKRPAPETLAPAEEIFTAATDGRYRVTCSQDCADLEAAGLWRFAALVFMTTGELPLSGENRDGLMAWIARGGAFVGVHCATDTFYEYQPYVDMIGGTFDGHPWHEEVTVRVDDPHHPIVSGLQGAFAITDEIYQFRNFRRHPVCVLLALDPASVDIGLGKREDRDYALAWTRDWGEGRVFYCALGHREEVWRDARFQALLERGIDWAIDGPDRPARHPDGAKLLFRPRVEGGGVQPPDFSRWQHAGGKPAGWKVVGAAMEVAPGAGDLVTKDAFGDGLYHVEFMTPAMPEASGQARGNSGVYLQGRYEVQVLDSYSAGRGGLALGPGDCGSIYGKHVAAVNAGRPPERWQSYDIEFRAPRFDAAGKKTANARLSVWHNGIRIHADVEVDGPTAAGEASEAPLGPLLLQDHGDAVRYRNVWVLPRPM